MIGELKTVIIQMLLMIYNFKISVLQLFIRQSSPFTRSLYYPPNNSLPADVFVCWGAAACCACADPGSCGVIKDDIAAAALDCVLVSAPVEPRRGLLLVAEMLLCTPRWDALDPLEPPCAGLITELRFIPPVPLPPLSPDGGTPRKDWLDPDLLESVSRMKRF